MIHRPCLWARLVRELAWVQATVGLALTAQSIPTDALAATGGPTSLAAHLDRRQTAAARQGRLGWQMSRPDAARPTVVPAQWEWPAGEGAARATFLVPEGCARSPHSSWRATRAPFASTMQAQPDPASGQVDVREGDHPVLRYNYRTIEPGERTNQVTEANRIYARRRSDYIHPLYSLNGTALTRDWPLDHPHHRGIYWAWPEVEVGAERGDLHALQRVFARPTGNLKLTSGPVFAQVEAENLWLWEDREPVVRERATIRAYRATTRGRLVELLFQFVGLRDGVSVARRETSHYGGLNLRLATPASQQIAVHADGPGAVPRRAWSDLSGLFGGAEPAGLTVLQHAQNPEFPGEWVQYPELSWCQPTFPTAGTRYALKRDQPLRLRFRLWVHAGTALDAAWAARLCDAWQAPQAALIPAGP